MTQLERKVMGQNERQTWRKRPEIFPFNNLLPSGPRNRRGVGGRRREDERKDGWKGRGEDREETSRSMSFCPESINRH